MEASHQGLCLWHRDAAPSADRWKYHWVCMLHIVFTFLPTEAFQCHRHTQPSNSLIPCLWRQYTKSTVSTCMRTWASKTWHQIGQHGVISIVMKLYGKFQKQKLKEKWKLHQIKEQSIFLNKIETWMNSHSPPKFRFNKNNTASAINVPILAWF